MNPANFKLAYLTKGMRLAREQNVMLRDGVKRKELKEFYHKVYLINYNYSFAIFFYKFFESFTGGVNNVLHEVGVPIIDFQVSIFFER